VAVEVERLSWSDRNTAVAKAWGSSAGVSPI